MNYNWLIKMAWRDSRKNVSRLLLFMTSIILGIAALVAINSFGSNLVNEINSEAKELLGADLEIESRSPLTEEITEYIDSLDAKVAKEVNFASMVLFPKNEGSRLVQVRAIEEAYPFYGTIETAPENSRQALARGRYTLVDRSLLLQFNVSPGDSVKIGNVTFEIAGAVTKVPGQAGISTSAAPPVFIPYNYLEETGLLQKGSRIEYKSYLKFNSPVASASYIEENVVPKLEEENIRFDTVEERKEEIGDAYEDLTGFLNLIAFVALLLGSMGVASSVHIYIKEKVTSIAILRSLGVTGNQAVGIFLIQITAIGLLGGLAGAVLGTIIQFLLPVLFSEFLPVTVTVSLSWISIIEGIVLGPVVSLLFALMPLISIKKVSPLTALRASVESRKTGKEVYWVILAVVIFILLFSYLQLDRITEALLFTGGIILAFLSLFLTGKALIFLVRKYFPVQWSYTWRQSLSNLYRPNNQTLVLVITIGLGTALVTTLFFVQSILLKKVEFADQGNQANMVLFDIQSEQLSGVKEITKDFNLPVINEVPVVTMRLASINDRSVEEIKEDTTSKVRNWVLRREYRVTYKDSLTEAEEVTAGKWQGEVTSPEDSIYVSLSENLVEDMKVEVGDKVTFNVQGALIETYIGSIRKVDWRRLQTNFMVVFPEGVLEEAPKFHVLLTRTDSARLAAEYQKAIVKQFPNISLIDLKLILKTVDEIVSKVSFVIKFMAFFSIATGIIVLISSVILSKFQRIQESVILRTLGASRKQILTINGLEYMFLGAIAALTGLTISLLTSWALAVFTFDTSFTPDLLPIVIAFAGIITLTVGIGLLNARSVVKRPPLEVLRKEV